MKLPLPRVIANLLQQKVVLSEKRPSRTGYDRQPGNSRQHGVATQRRIRANSPPSIDRCDPVCHPLRENLIEEPIIGPRIPGVIATRTLP